jgi:hypothetical protein
MVAAELTGMDQPYCINIRVLSGYVSQTIALLADIDNFKILALSL